MTRRDVLVDLDRDRVRRTVGAPFDGLDATVPAGAALSVTAGPRARVATTSTPDDPPPPIVVEEFPASGSVNRVLTPSSSQSQINNIQSGEIVEFMPGAYGDKNLQVLSSRTGVYAFCRAVVQPNGMFGHKWNGNPAYFQHGHDGTCLEHPFVWNMGANNTLRGLRVRGFSANPNPGSTRTHGNGMIRVQGQNCKLWDLELSHTKESAFQPNGRGTHIKRVAAHHLGRYVCANGSNDLLFETMWCYEIDTNVTDSLGLRPPQETSDKGICKLVAVDNARWFDIHGWDIGAMGVWWDGGSTNGVLRGAYFKNVARNCVNLEINFGPFTIEDIYAEDSANASNDGVDVIRAVVLNPLTPDVTVRRVEAVRCGNGVCTTNRNHNVLNVGMPGTGHSAQFMRDRLGVRNLLVEDCDFTQIEGGSGRNANRYNAGWAGGEFTHSSGDVIPFRNNRWRNNQYSPNARFRAGSDFPINRSRWQNTYGMS